MAKFSKSFLAGAALLSTPLLAQAHPLHGSGGLASGFTHPLLGWDHLLVMRADGIASPKLSLVFGPWAKTEVYVQGGLGFHSNDGRGATTTVDPVDGVTPVPRADPLVQTYGAEVGIRTLAVDGLQSTLSLWWLDVDSELLFVGDAGATEASRPSRRYGVEWANFYNLTKNLTLEATTPARARSFGCHRQRTRPRDHNFDQTIIRLRTA